jgi:hypothetical protein
LVAGERLPLKRDRGKIFDRGGGLIEDSSYTNTRI